MRIAGRRQSITGWREMVGYEHRGGTPAGEGRRLARGGAGWEDGCRLANRGAGRQEWRSSVEEPTLYLGSVEEPTAMKEFG